jgi:hypothetical protein
VSIFYFCLLCFSNFPRLAWIDLHFSFWIVVCFAYFPSAFRFKRFRVHRNQVCMSTSVIRRHRNQRQRNARAEKVWKYGNGKIKHVEIQNTIHVHAGGRVGIDSMRNCCHQKNERALTNNTETVLTYSLSRFLVCLHARKSKSESSKTKQSPRAPSPTCILVFTRRRVRQTRARHSRRADARRARRRGTLRGAPGPRAAAA